MLLTQINAIKARESVLVNYVPQKIRENFVLNASDVAVLTQFARQGDNLSKLGWDLSRPETWRGIQWLYASGEYHVQEISISNLALTGDLNLSGMIQLTRVSCDNNNLTSINVSGCSRLVSLSCRSAGISSLNILNCNSLRFLDCEDNYLRVSDIINDVTVVLSRSNAWVRYLDQRISGAFNISGTVNSFNPKNETIIELFEKVTDANMLRTVTPVFTYTIVGEPDGFGVSVNNFNFEVLVHPGEYTLRVRKAGHLSFIKLALAMEERDIDLDNIIGVIMLNPGDFDGDGVISPSDLTAFLSNYGRSGLNITNPFTDIDGDGVVGPSDLTLFLSRYGRSNIVIP
jgi:hypothetical protein